MRMVKLTILLTLLALSIAASAATPIVFKLKPIPLANGWEVTGTITTDGTLGPLAAANITSWNLQVVQTTDVVWTEKDSNDFNISGVSTDGKGIFVATSPDGIQDGGTLYFSRGGGGGTIPTSAAISDFTQLSVNLGYGMGGISGWQDEILGLNYIGLNRKNNTQYRAASTIVGKPNVFQIRGTRLSPPPILMTMFGKITTDGTIGALLPPNIIAWNVTARTQEITNYTEANSVVLFATGVTSDGIVIKVDHAVGQFGIGIGGPRPTFVTLADFTDPTFPNGFANYYMGNYGVMGDKSPLVGKGALTYIVGKK